MACIQDDGVCIILSIVRWCEGMESYYSVCAFGESVEMSIVIERRSVKRTLILTSPRPRNEMNCPWTTPPVEKYSNSQCPQTWLAIRLRSRTTECAMAASMKELTMATWCHYPPPLLLLLQLRWWWQRRRRYCSTWPWRQRRHTEIEQNVRGEAPHRPMTTWQHE